MNSTTLPHGEHIALNLSSVIRQHAESVSSVATRTAYVHPSVRDVHCTKTVQDKPMVCIEDE